MPISRPGAGPVASGLGMTRPGSMG
jgi:hypothetical protein